MGNSRGNEPDEAEHDRCSEQNGQELGADRVLFDEHVPNQADIQVFVRTVRAEVQIRLPIFDQMNAGWGFMAVETQVQMRSADARNDQKSAGQDE